MDFTRHQRTTRTGGATKVFCIGLNKTGTTTLKASLQELGYRMGRQWEAEHLLPAWLARDFAPIVSFAQGAEAFQDVPFSLPFTYQALDAAFPEAKFVLSVRSSAEEWYQSVLRFTRAAYEHGRLPTAQELKADAYRYPGFMYDAQCGTVPGTEADPFDRAAHIAYYENHEYCVRSYFRGDPRLKVIDVANPESYRELCAFLGRAPKRDVFPHLNPSS